MPTEIIGHDTKNEIIVGHDDSDKHIAFGGAIKSISKNRIGGYLVQFTDADNKDLDGEYFTKDTNFDLDNHPLVGKPVLFHHGMTKQIGIKTYGKFDKAVIDEHGVYVEADITTINGIFDKAKEFGEIIKKEHLQYLAYLSEIYQYRDKGFLSWSSGALPQSVIVGGDGHIKQWVFIEGSETHTPANPSGTKIFNLKSITSNIPDLSIEPTAKESHGNTLDDLPSDVKNITNVVSELSVNHQLLKESIMSNTKMSDEHMATLRERLREVLDMLSEYDMDADKMEEEVLENVESKMDDEEDMKSFDFGAVIDDAIMKAFQRRDEKAKRDNKFKKLAEQRKNEMGS